MKTSVLATGLQGLIGSKFAQLFAEKYDFISLDIHDPVQPTDITDFEQVMRAFQASDAAAVIHLAAFTDVTAAWQQTGDRNGLAYKVNVIGTENIVKAAQETGKHLIHISTSYVFDGKQPQPYLETDTPSPLEWYGETKLIAEERVQASSSPWTILRIDQPFRSDSFARPDVVRKMAAAMAKPDKPKFFTDHYFGPTFIDDFAQVIEWAIRTQSTGLFHASAGEQWTDYQLAETLCRVKNLAPHFEAGSLAEYLKTAQRPYQVNTAMNCQKLKAALDFSLLSVEEALTQIQL